MDDTYGLAGMGAAIAGTIGSAGIIAVLMLTNRARKDGDAYAIRHTVLYLQLFFASLITGLLYVLDYPVEVWEKFGVFALPGLIVLVYVEIINSPFGEYKAIMKNWSAAAHAYINRATQVLIASAAAVSVMYALINLVTEDDDIALMMYLFGTWYALFILWHHADRFVLQGHPVSISPDSHSKQFHATD